MLLAIIPLTPCAMDKLSLLIASTLVQRLFNKDNWRCGRYTLQPHISEVKGLKSNICNHLHACMVTTQQCNLILLSSKDMAHILYTLDD